MEPLGRTLETGLEGRLEVVLIRQPVKEGSNICWGVVLNYPNYGGRVQVHRAMHRQNKPCLVRFNFRQNAGFSPRGNFIARNYPLEFRGISPQDYFLYSIWDKHWTRAEDYPTLDEINEHFEPGEMGRVIYFKRGFNESSGSVVILPKGIRPFQGSFETVFSSESFKPMGHSRVVILEWVGDVIPLVNESKKVGLTAVKMDYL
ncbi:MAG: hypothetical protein WC796_06135 [Candidatus Pacearchaeota archaeon]|jgi:hypothetical protein